VRHGRPEALTRLLDSFFAYEPPVIEDWRVAIRQFQEDLPHILDELRARIDTAYTDNADFRAQADTFLAHARETVNPNIGEPDVREMLIQHILTEDIFNHVFNNAVFHRQNNVAQKLYALEEALFTQADKRALLRALEPYYATIRANAAMIDSHDEKQQFLKTIYETFYKVYDPKKADRLGVVYTPTEIVRFMVEGADWLCREHFGRGLIDEGVEILDPAAGTGTFIVELLNHFAGQPEKLARKYKCELHANEVAILPYYVANLNIEATYEALTGQYGEFENLCFVDTLDNTAALGLRRGEMRDLFAAWSDENAARVRRQNDRTITLIIGNPPYNANQQNENDNNKNREYPHMDSRVKATFVKLSTAQKTKVYDMYSRFYRWAFDRIADEGIVAFVTNRSFIDSRTFDGFRRYVTENFGDIYLADLGGDVRANPKLSGTTHNVFGIQTGVTIGFFVKGGKGRGLHYVRGPRTRPHGTSSAGWRGTRPGH
jgi:predicted helicase